ncbi:hypothetical protein SESBI_37749 [Sesbania bispinosa]|nr:hypothetical protein SESBI_37749 [Sesbania bispinosa]
MESVNGNEDPVVNETSNNDTHAGDLEDKGGQEPFIGMEFQSREDAYDHSTLIMLNVLDMACLLKLVAVQKFLEISLM